MYLDASKARRSFVQPGMCHVQGVCKWWEWRSAASCTDPPVPLFFVFFLQSKLQMHGRHGCLPSSLYFTYF